MTDTTGTPAPPDVPRTARTYEEQRITVYYPGIIVAETDDVPISPPQTPEAIVLWLRPSAFAFVVRTVLCADPIDDGRGGTLNVTPRELTKSGVYFPGGEVFTVEEIAAMGAEYRTLLANVEHCGAAVKTRVGSWQPFGPGDRVIPTGGVA